MVSGAINRFASIASSGLGPPENRPRQTQPTQPPGHSRHFSSTAAFQHAARYPSSQHEWVGQHPGNSGYAFPNYSNQSVHTDGSQWLLQPPRPTGRNTHITLEPTHPSHSFAGFYPGHDRDSEEDGSSSIASSTRSFHLQDHPSTPQHVRSIHSIHSPISSTKSIRTIHTPPSIPSPSQRNAEQVRQKLHRSSAQKPVFEAAQQTVMSSLQQGMSLVKDLLQSPAEFPVTYEHQQRGQVPTHGRLRGNSQPQTWHRDQNMMAGGYSYPYAEAHPQPSPYASGFPSHPDFWDGRNPTAVSTPESSFYQPQFAMPYPGNMSQMDIFKSEGAFYEDPLYDDDRMSIRTTSVTATATATATASTTESLKNAKMSGIANRPKGGSMRVPNVRPFKGLAVPVTPRLSVLACDWTLSSFSQILDASAKKALLQAKLEATVEHLEDMNDRVADPSSRVLVTGDLNSGKSTLINGFLKRDVMPVDQQPLTNAFCEVTDANVNGGVEEVHAVTYVDDRQYNSQNPDTFTKVETDQLYSLIEDDDHPFPMLKVYTKDKRKPEESLLSNDRVPLRIIDSPGLNRDSVSTTSIFRREKQIDIVVFVMSAENHFTLSGTEFLKQACAEKAWIFVVVNKWERIRDKAKCQRQIREQLQDCLPQTASEGELLVHFVSCEEAVRANENNQPVPEDFAKLETSLRQFVLDRRVQSKLAPAKEYTMNLSKDLKAVAEFNKDLQTAELQTVREAINQTRPVHQLIVEGKDRTLKNMRVWKNEAHGRMEESLENGIRSVYYDSAFTVEELQQRRRESRYALVPPPHYQGKNEIKGGNQPVWRGILYAKWYASAFQDYLLGMYKEDVGLCEQVGRRLVQEYGEKMVRTVRDDQLWASKVMTLPELQRMESDESSLTCSDKHMFTTKDFNISWNDLATPYKNRLRQIMGQWLSGFSMPLAKATAGSQILELGQGQQSMAMSITKALICGFGAKYGSKWGILGMMVLGAAAVTYFMSDMKPHVDSMILSKFRESLIRQSSTLPAPTLIELEKLLFELESKLTETIKESEKEQKDLEVKLNETEELIRWFAEFGERVKMFMGDVEGIDLES